MKAIKETKIQLHAEIGQEMAKTKEMTPAVFVEKTKWQLELIKKITKIGEENAILLPIFKEMATNAILMAQKLGDTRSFTEICETLNKVYIAKNKDYGDSFGLTYKEYGMIMPCIRLEDKLRRFEALAVKGQEAQVLDEKITDTLIDLANYAILTAIELK